MSVPSSSDAKKWKKKLDEIKPRAYWIIGLLVIFITSYIFYNSMQRPVAGALFFVGGFIVLYYYWVKWFVIKPPPDADFSPTLACPDYLSLIPPGDLYPDSGNGRYFCVDFVGVSTNGVLNKVTPANLRQKIRDPSYHFEIDPMSDFKSRASQAELMKRLKAAGLSWNSLGGNSIPTRGGNRNGSPTYEGDRGGQPGMAGRIGASASTAAPVGSGNNPVYEAAVADAALLTLEQMKGIYQEMKNAGVGKNQMPKDSQVVPIMKNLISKGLFPPGTEFSSVFARLVKTAPTLTQAQAMQLQV